jgi:hypothetical protein
MPHDQVIRKRGFLVFPQAAGPGAGLFLDDEIAAEQAANRLLGRGGPVVVVPATYYSTPEIEGRPVETE